MADYQITHSQDCWSWGRAHYECAVQEIKTLQKERDALRKALEELITWVPSADTYRRLGFNPEAPMRAYNAAKAALVKEHENG